MSDNFTLLGSILGSSIIAAVVSGFFALRTNDRNIQIDNTTKERAKWRDKIRSRAKNICEAYDEREAKKFKVLRLVFAVNLNPNDDEDNGILSLIDKLSEPESTDKNLLEFSTRISLLLKHDWERGKYESKPWIARIFSQTPERMKYEEFLAMSSGSEFFRVLKNKESQDRAGVSVACLLLLLLFQTGLLPANMDLIKPLLWVGFVLYGCLCASKFLAVLASRPKTDA